MSIMGNMVGAYSSLGKTLIITDEAGNELTGVVTEKVQIFSATPEDVKIGKVFASGDGVQEGVDTKTYRVRHGTQLILPEETFVVPLKEYDGYDYTKFQAVVSLFNTTEFDSVETEKTILYDYVYNVNSSDKISNVTKDEVLKSINFNLINNTDNTYIIHYNTYKEE